MAESPYRIGRGQFMPVDARGVPYGRSRYVRRARLYKLAVYVALAGVIVLIMADHFVPGLVLYTVVAAPILYSQYCGTAPLFEIEMLAWRGQLDEARRRFAGAGMYRTRNPAMYGWVEGVLAAHRGEHEHALLAWRSVLPRAGSMRRAAIRQAIAKSLAIQGKHVEAERELDGIALPEGADEILFGSLLARLVVIAANPAAKARSEQLHDWMRQLLEYNHTGVELACIAMIAERQGDTETTELAASEARERMHYPYVPTWWPAMQAWLDDHAAAGES
jgi:hypothetical protein